MAKSIELRKDIYSLIKSEHERVFHRQASSIVYKITDLGDSKELEIDYWDRNNSSETIENLADNIEKLLDEEVVNSSEHSFIIYYNNDRKFVDDEDKNIQRVNETFEIRYFRKE